METTFDNTRMVNILLDMCENRPAEPIDEPDCHPLDYADVTGLFDEMYPCDDWYF